MGYWTGVFADHAKFILSGSNFIIFGEISRRDLSTCSRILMNFGWAAFYVVAMTYFSRVKNRNLFGRRRSSLSGGGPESPGGEVTAAPEKKLDLL